jgi:HEAT repeat protein
MECTLAALHRVSDLPRIRWLGGTDDSKGVINMRTRTIRPQMITRWAFLPALALAALALSGCGEQRKSVKTLISELSDTDRDTRYGAAKDLEDYGPEAKPAVPALAEALSDEDAKVRYRAAKALSKVKGGLEPAIPALAEALADAGRDVRYYAAKTLDDAGNEVGPALAAIAAALEKEEDAKIRYYLVKSLKNLGAEAAPAVAALQKAAKDKNDDVRKTATAALANINRQAVQTR